MKKSILVGVLLLGGVVGTAQAGQCSTTVSLVEQSKVKLTNLANAWIGGGSAEALFAAKNSLNTIQWGPYNSLYEHQAPSLNPILTSAMNEVATALGGTPTPQQSNSIRNVLSDLGAALGSSTQCAVGQ